MGPMRILRILPLFGLSAVLGGWIAVGAALAVEAVADKAAYSRFFAGLSSEALAVAERGRTVFETS